MTDDMYWVWMSLAFNGKYAVMNRLLLNYGNPKKVYETAEAGALEELNGQYVDTDLDEAAAIYAYCSKYNIGILTLDNEYYPQKLKIIKDRPLLLYYRGRIPDLSKKLCIATVGTRQMSEYGRREAYKIVYDLARRGAAIVSGMALGVDGVCHRAALDAGGLTIAVLGCGIDIVYPPQHELLMEEIAAGGTIFTEFKPGTKPIGRNFPIRNRIISGLSRATFVIEAGQKSGAMITARNALYQGRDVFALPGKVGELNSSGTNELIKNGAKAVTNAVDILDKYECDYVFKNVNETRAAAVKNVTPQIKPPVVDNNAQKRTKEQIRVNEPHGKDSILYKADAGDNITTEIKAAPVITDDTEKNQTAGNAKINVSVLSEQERKVYNIICGNPGVTCDDIIDAGISASDVMTALTMLEINDLIESAPGGIFQLKKK